jgi:hypothetical protein
VSKQHISLKNHILSYFNDDLLKDFAIANEISFEEIKAMQGELETRSWEALEE